MQYKVSDIIECR